MQFQGAVRSAPWCPCEYTCDRQDLLKFGVQRYLRNSALAANLDVKTYDVGNFIFATQCQALTATPGAGELYVTYEVELHTPQLNLSTGSFTGQKIVGAVSISDVQIFGTTPVYTGTQAFTAAVNTLTCVIPGQYLFELDFVGTSMTSNMPSATTGTATVVSLNSTGGLLPCNATGTTATGIWTVNATAGQTVIVDGSAAGTITATNVRFTSFLVALGLDAKKKQV